jgi:hypothetical protein
MKWPTFPSSLAVLLAILLGTVCAQIAADPHAKLPFLTISPSGPVTVERGATRQFIANGAGSRDAGVNWQITGSLCAETACGTISADGLYSAPDKVSEPLQVTVSVRSMLPPFVSTTEQIVVVPRLAKGHRPLCTSAQPGYCHVEWQIHQMFAPYAW